MDMAVESDAIVRIDQVSHTDTRSAYALALCLMLACGAVALLARVLGSRRWESISKPQ